MAPLTAPWFGLARCAAQVDLWPIIGHLGGTHAASAASAAAWVQAGLPSRHAALVHEVPGELGHGGVHAADRAWPSRLIGLPCGPVALHAEGDLSRLAAPAVAIIGARACTPGGRARARAYAEAVVAAGGVVVSGLAAGIDAAAHEAAGGATIAVLGQGLGVPLSRWQEELRARVVAAGGLVVSEFPAGQVPALWTFPVRNRVIAGLAQGVVVIEAASRSGTKITARLALEYGREVAAVPGPPEAPTSQGCLDLLEDGARLIRGPQTVVELLGRPRPGDRGSAGGSVSGSAGGSDNKSSENLLFPPEDPLLTLIGAGATVDDLASRSGLPTGVLLAQLAQLEFSGRVARVAGARYEPRSASR